MQKIPQRRSPGFCHVVLADDQAIFRAGVARVLSAQHDVTSLVQCQDAAELMVAAEKGRSCVIVVTQSLQADMYRLFKVANGNASRVILITDTGVVVNSGILSRLDGRLTRQATADELLNCVRRVNNGERVLANVVTSDTVGDRMRDQLSARELQIIGFVVQGCKNRQIAAEIGTSEQVVKNYLRSIYDKTGSSDRLELALFTLHHRPLAQAASRAIEMMPQRTSCV